MKKLTPGEYHVEVLQNGVNTCKCTTDGNKVVHILSIVLIFQLFSVF